MSRRWAPQDVDDVLLAFPAQVEHLMPPRDECEAALAALPRRGMPWRRFQSDWLARGLPPSVRVRARPGVDLNTAFRHLAAIQGSYQPKHEHKEAAVAYLASLWFEEPPEAA